MILFNFKNWSGLKIALGVSIVFNAFLLIVMFTGMQTQIMAQNERDLAQRKNEGLTRIYDSTKLLEKCINDTKSYQTNIPEFKGKNVVIIDDLATCFSNWK